VGAWTPHGVGWPALWTGLLEGRHAFEPVGDDFGPDPRLLAGRIRDLQPFRDAFPSVKPPLPISVTRMAMVAAQQALAGLDPALRSNYGVMLNRSRGPARVVADIMKPVLAGGPRKTSPLLFSQSVANAPLGAIATAFGLRGPHLLTLGGGAIMVAFDAIRRGDAPGIVVGGFEEHAPEVFEADLANGVMPAIHDESEIATRGPLLSEGAICLMLESEQVARARGAQPLARLLAVERSSGRASGDEDPLRLWGRPDPAEFARSCARALERAGRSSAAIDFHAGGSANIPAFERAESSMRAELGLACPRGSIKALLGEGLGMGAIANLAWASAMIAARQLACATIDAGVGSRPLPDSASILVTHFDAHANQCAMVLSSPD